MSPLKDWIRRGQRWFPQALFAVIIVPYVTCILVRRDFWPYSFYPMFSAPRSVEAIPTYRIAIEDTSGEIRWWNPDFDYCSRDFGIPISRAYRNEGDDMDTLLPVIRASLRKAVHEMSAMGDLHDVKKLHVVKRSAVTTPEGFSFQDQTVFVTGLEELRN